MVLLGDHALTIVTSSLLIYIQISSNPLIRICDVLSRPLVLSLMTVSLLFIVINSIGGDFDFCLPDKTNDRRLLININYIFLREVLVKSGSFAPVS